MPVDIEKLLAAVSPDSPCGDDMVYEPAYLELERQAQGTPAQYAGERLVAEAVPPDWRVVRDQAVELLGHSKDLRVAVYLAEALLGLEGLGGLRDGLTLLRGLIERHWDDVHPRLDPDDGFDPLERLSILSAFAAPIEKQEPPASFGYLLSAALCTSPVFHRSYSLRDIRIARGEIAPPPDAAQPPATLEELQAAFTGEKLLDRQREELAEQLRQTAAAAREAAGQLQAISALLVERVGADKAPDYGVFGGMLSEIATTIGGFLGAPAGEAHP